MLEVIQDQRIDELEKNIENFAHRRCLNAGYTDKEIKVYNKAIRTQNAELLNTLRCRCYDGYLCPKHHILHRISIYNPNWKKGWSKKTNKKSSRK